MSTVKNSFTSTVKVHWCNSKGTTCPKPIDGGDFDPNVPRIGGSMGFLILKVLGVKKSQITLNQPIPQNYKFMFYYNTDSCEWEIYADGGGETHVNIEIGPRP